MSLLLIKLMIEIVEQLISFFIILKNVTNKTNERITHDFNQIQNIIKFIGPLVFLSYYS